MKDNYMIRSDYVSRPGNRSLDTETQVFWEPSRIRDNLSYQAAVYEWGGRLLRGLESPTVLDIGCGPATKLVKYISPLASVVGIDQESAVNYCRSTYSVGEFFADNFEKPELSLDYAFDLIICSDVIEHMDNPDVLLDYIKRFASAKSLILLSTPDRVRLRGKRCVESPKIEHVREWSFVEFSEYLHSRGFRVKRQRHLSPVKTGPNYLTALHLAVQWGRLRPYKFNQAALCTMR